MKFDDIDFYVNKLWEEPPLPDDDEGGILSSFDERMAEVMAVIDDAYDEAMRWHSAQIAKGSEGLSSTSSDYDQAVNPDNGYPYWGDCGPNG